MNVGVLGGSSPIGQQLIPLLLEHGNHIFAITRMGDRPSPDQLTWLPVPAPGQPTAGDALPAIDLWISVAPIWVLQKHLPWLQATGVKKIVALSSTSRFTKTSSSDLHEAKVVNDLIGGEAALQQWAIKNSIQWVILRPTLIYGRSTDRNLSEISRMIRRFGFFPLLGPAGGLRQPVYVDDVAQACAQAAYSQTAVDAAYNISGGEVLSYRDMVSRIFIAMGRSPRFLPVNISIFKIAIAALRLLPRYRHWSFNMADRMSKDMVFEHELAKRDFGFNPRPFQLADRDVQ